MTTLYGYKKCSTVQKARKTLDEWQIQYTHIDNVATPLTTAELTAMIERSNLDIKKFFNTSGMRYRELNLKDKLPAMSTTEKISLLASDGMLVKRPILVTDELVLVGFKKAEWEVLHEL